MHEHNAFPLSQINDTIAVILGVTSGNFITHNGKKITARIPVNLLPSAAQDQQIMSGQTVKRKRVAGKHCVTCVKNGGTISISAKHEDALYESIRGLR